MCANHFQLIMFIADASVREIEFGNDWDYSEKNFINTIVNAHLANTIGNLLNRTLRLLKKNCQSTLVADSSVAAEGNDFKDTVEKLIEKSKVQYESLLVSSACESVLEIGTAGNLYIDGLLLGLFLNKEDLVLILEAMRIIAVALSPVTPKLCLSSYRQLGYTEEQVNAVTWSDTKWGGLKAGQVVAPPNPIFARIEVITEDEGGPTAEKKVSKKKLKSPQTQRDV